MNKQEATAIAASFFPSYPSVNVFHVTDDGQVFESDSAAGNHARDIQSDDDKKAEKKASFYTINREECEATESEETEVEKAEANVKYAEGVVIKLQTQLEKAAAKNKPAVQEKLTAAEKELADCKKHLEDLRAAK